ncbi:MAG: phosphodiesterase [Spirochaetales bacterium]|nr:phosphodiesterase [Spirochaetales bacterium]
MKLFIISDIHGSALAFNKAVEAFNCEQASLMVICGDYLNHGPRNPLPEGHDTKALAAALNSMKAKICGVRGNCDSEVDQMMLDFPVTEASCRIMLLGSASDCAISGATAPDGAALAGAGAQSIKTVAQCAAAESGKVPPSGCIFIHHGHLYTKQKAAELTEPGTIIVSGHTHVPVLEYEDGRYFVNPGSISLPKDGSSAGYATIETGAGGAIKEICLNKLDGTTFASMSL